jgi:hypothetical protein
MRIFGDARAVLDFRAPRVDAVHVVVEAVVVTLAEDFELEEKFEAEEEGRVAPQESEIFLFWKLGKKNEIFGEI